MLCVLFGFPGAPSFVQLRKTEEWLIPRLPSQETQWPGFVGSDLLPGSHYSHCVVIKQSRSQSSEYDNSFKRCSQRSAIARREDKVLIRNEKWTLGHAKWETCYLWPLANFCPWPWPHLQPCEAQSKLIRQRHEKRSILNHMAYISSFFWEAPLTSFCHFCLLIHFHAITQYRFTLIGLSGLWKIFLQPDRPKWWMTNSLKLLFSCLPAVIAIPPNYFEVCDLKRDCL